MTSPSKFPLKKTRGRPLGSTSKKKPAAARKSFKQPNAAAQEEKLLQAHIELMVKTSDLRKNIANLEHQAIGYQAVISYLEHQLGKTNERSSV
jgi:hypothetical protein